NAEQGVTVLLTTHDLDDIERLCPRILVIDHGRVIYDGGLDSLKAQMAGERTLIVDLVEPGPPLTVAGALVDRVEGARQWLRFRRGDLSAAALIAEVVAQAPVSDLSIVEPDIEDVIRRIYTSGPQLAP
ncbi:MAG: viologen exporter family transport system ATP-binding protein, partial [Acidimicrobiaceae bacterium]|nr:viologen exporter family transport system ATP-binding protein [Acidimicrobiaceae bacterium]